MKTILCVLMLCLASCSKHAPPSAECPHLQRGHMAALAGSPVMIWRIDGSYAYVQQQRYNEGWVRCTSLVPL